MVCWNCKGAFLVQKPPTAQNFSFGHIGVNSMVFNIPLQDLTKEIGRIESWDKHVTPHSLYFDATPRAAWRGRGAQHRRSKPNRPKS